MPRLPQAGGLYPAYAQPGSMSLLETPINHSIIVYLRIDKHS